MAYGTIKVDNITFDNGGVDKLITVSGLFYSTSGALTVTGTISGGNVTAPTATFTTLTGTTTTGTTATFTSGSFTTLTGTTVTGTTANFVSGVFTTQISGATITGTTVATTTGSFVSLTGTTATFTSGIIASGTAALPSLAILSDPNTGIYSPGADQLAISTNGTGRLFVDASGNVTLGTTTAPGSNGKGIALYDASFPRLSFRNSTTGDANTDGTQILMNGNNFTIANTENGYTSFENNGSERMRITSTGALNFVGAGTAGSTQAVSFNGSAPVNSLVIDSSGRLGIGTSSPSAPLHLSTGATAASALFASTDSTAYSATSFLSGARLRLQGGNATNAYNGITFGNNSNAEGFIGFVQNVSGYNDFVVQSYAGTYSEKLRVTSAGNVGIGTTSPTYKLHVLGSTGIIKGESANATFGSPSLSLNDTTHSVEIILTPMNGLGAFGTYTNHPLAFYTNNGEKARLDSSGRLLVGTSSSLVSTSLVQVAGTNYPAMSINSFGTSSNPEYIFRSARGTQASPTVSVNDDKLGAIYFQGYDGVEYLGGAKIEAFVDGAVTGGGTDDLPGRLVFSTTADGAASPTPRMQIGSSGTARFFTSNYGLLLGNSQSAGTTYTAFEVYAGSTNTTTLGTLTLQIYNNGNVQNTNNSYGAISDIKLKENIVDAGSQWADIKAFRVRKYNLKEGQKHTQIGGIAQEVELVSPGLVSESPDRDEEGNDLGTVTKSINYSVLYMKAVKALQEAMERIETLETRLSALEGA